MPSDTLTSSETDAGDDLRSLLNASFDEHETKPETAPALKVEAEAPPETRQRAPDGKFAKVETPEEVTEKPSPEIKPETVEVKPPEAKPETPGAEPPAHWAEADKATFKALAAEAQQFLLRRSNEMEADYTRKTTAISALKRDYEPVQAILAPFDAQIKSKGFTPASLIQAWSNVELALTNPANAPRVVADIVANYKVDRASLARALGFEVPGTPPAPDGASPIHLPPELIQTLQTLDQRQQQYDQHLSAQRDRERVETENRVMSTITAFRDAKDEAGNALHPHYDELEAEMIDLLTSARARGAEPTLEELYDKAVWANTSTRDKVLTSQRAADEAQRETTRKAEEAGRVAAEEAKRVEARAKAEKAKKAASSVTGAPGSGQARLQQAKDGDLSLRDQLLAAHDEMADA